MNLREALVLRGYMSGGGKKARCVNPEHRDEHPSSIVNLNSIYCFGCSRLYRLKQISAWLGVDIEEIPGDQFQKKTGEPLFVE